MNLKTVKGQIENILATIPATRDSDIELTIELWKKFYPKYVRTGANGEQGIWLKDLHNVPRQDYQKRYRAYFQNTLHQYLPSTIEIAKRRNISETKWREIMGISSEHLRL